MYSLLELVDPALFPTPEHFEQHRRQARGLSSLVEQLGQHDFPIPGKNEHETAGNVASWLGISAELARQRLAQGGAELEAVIAELSSRHLLSEILIRNRKPGVGGFMPRRATRWEVKLRDDERRARRHVGRSSALMIADAVR